MGMTGGANLYGGSFLISMLFVVGGVPGLWLVEKIGRRKLLLWSFGVIVLALAVPAFSLNVQAAPLFIALAIFVLASGASSFSRGGLPQRALPRGSPGNSSGLRHGNQPRWLHGQHLPDAGRYPQLRRRRLAAHRRCHLPGRTGGYLPPGTGNRQQVPSGAHDRKNAGSTGNRQSN